MPDFCIRRAITLASTQIPSGIAPDTQIPSGIAAEPADEAYASVFDQTRVQTYDITVDPADLARISGTGNLYKEVWPMYDSAETYQKALETNKGGDVTRMVNFKQAIDRGASTALEWLDRAMMRYLLATCHSRSAHAGPRRTRY